jgi:hypothetical protein
MTTPFTDSLLATVASHAFSLVGGASPWPVGLPWIAPLAVAGALAVVGLVARATARERRSGVDRPATARRALRLAA